MYRQALIMFLHFASNCFSPLLLAYDSFVTKGHNNFSYTFKNVLETHINICTSFDQIPFEKYISAYWDIMVLETQL